MPSIVQHQPLPRDAHIRRLPFVAKVALRRGGKCDSTEQWSERRWEAYLLHRAGEIIMIFYQARHGDLLHVPDREAS